MKDSKKQYKKTMKITVRDFMSIEYQIQTPKNNQSRETKKHKKITKLVDWQEGLTLTVI